MAPRKTEEPTPRKLRDARRRGEVPRSHALNAAAVLLAFGAGLVWLGPFMRQGLFEIMDHAVMAAADPGAHPPSVVLSQVAWMAVRTTAPLLGWVLLVAGVVAYLQVGPLFTMRPVAPRMERVDPGRGLGHLFSSRSLVEGLLTLGKMGVVGGVAWITLRDAWPGVVALPSTSPEGILSAGGGLVSALIWRVGGTVAAVAILDVVYRRWQHRRDQRMTRAEVERERREREGDPRARRRRGRMHRELARSGATQSVRGRGA
ncbi:MAG: EscU/YscU/HrcU family type III secretion system export apparatus switch protein [Myxococcota bacterium]